MNDQSKHLLITPEQAQDRLVGTTKGVWSTVQEGWAPEDHNYSIVSVTDQGYVTVAPAGGAEVGISGPDATLIEIAPDLAHTVAAEPERIRAAVVDALRTLAKRHDVAEAYDMANAIEDGAGW